MPIAGKSIFFDSPEYQYPKPLIEFHAPFYDEAGWVGYLKNHPLKSWGVDLMKMDIAW